MSTSVAAPRRGEIWLVTFDPTVGAEIQKTRPAIVVSSDAVGVLPIKLVAPLTDWKPHYDANVWHIRIDPDQRNRIDKASAVDVLQLRGMDHKRFIRKIVRLTCAMRCIGWQVYRAGCMDAATSDRSARFAVLEIPAPDIQPTGYAIVCIRLVRMQREGEPHLDFIHSIDKTEMAGYARLT